MYPLSEQHAGALYTHVVNQAQDSQVRTVRRTVLTTIVSSGFCLSGV